jgi:hypothetical protein
MLTLHRNLSALASLTSKKHFRLSLSGVLVEATAKEGKTGYTAVATDGKCLGMVEGTCPVQEEHYPASQSLTTAPNGATSAIIRTDDWKDTFKAMAKAPKRTAHKDLYNSLAVVMGQQVTTVGQCLGNTETVRQVQNIDCRFPAYRDVLKLNDQPIASVRLDAKILLELVKVASQFTDDDDEHNSVTLTLHGENNPVRVTTGNADQKFTGLLMPLTPNK